MTTTTSVVRRGPLAATNSGASLRLGPSRADTDAPTELAPAVEHTPRLDNFEAPAASTRQRSNVAAVAGPAPAATLDPTAWGYTPSNAMACGEMAELAYRLPARPDIVRERARQRGFTDVTLFDHGGTQAFIAVRQDVLVLAFAGTNVQELRDLVQDAKLIQDPLLDSQGLEVGHVHRGFREALALVWPDMLKEVQRRVREVPGRALIVTGHSPGAAMATLATAQLHEANLPVRATYLFGSPRVGDRKFCDWLNARATTLYQHQNQNDVVTRVPAVLDWEVVGAMRLRYLCGDGTVKIGADWFDTVVDRLQGRWASLTRNPASLGKADQSLSYTDGLVDHEMAEYLKKLAVQLRTGPARASAAAPA